MKKYGLSDDCEFGVKPACAVSDLRWVLRDPHLGVNVWLDLDALAKGLQMDKSELAGKWRAHVGPEAPWHGKPVFVSPSPPGNQLGLDDTEGVAEPPGDELKDGLFQLGAWNIQGKTVKSALATLSDFSVDLHVVAFQEVGGVAPDASASPVAVSEHEGYMVLTAQPAGCFRALSLAFDVDFVAHWCSVKIGHSHVLAVVDLAPFSLKVCMVTVHLPHSGRPMSDFHAALASLEACLTPFARKGHPIFLLGDLNVE